VSIEANKANLSFFDKWARSFDKGRLGSYFRHKQELALSLFPVGAKTRLLDVGCGTGWAVMEAARRAPQGWACGVDLSSAMVEEARRKTNGLLNAEFLLADAESLPYADGYFDCVLCTFSFHHYSTPERALEEMKRVLKPGGVLHILDNNRRSFLGLYGLWDLYFKLTEPGHVGYYSKEGLQAAVRKSGFKNVRLVASADEFFCRGKVFGSYMLVRGER